jgi:hypothetical protein
MSRASSGGRFSRPDLIVVEPADDTEPSFTARSLTLLTLVVGVVMVATVALGNAGVALWDRIAGVR